LTSASTDFTIAGQIFTGDPRGQIMLNFLTVGVHSTASAGSTYRLYLARDGAAPALSNLIRVGNVKEKSATGLSEVRMKLIIEPGDVLYAQLHSGDGLTLTGFGLRPVDG
jgi:hypothetical protein